MTLRLRHANRVGTDIDGQPSSASLHTESDESGAGRSAHRATPVGWRRAEAIAAVMSEHRRRRDGGDSGASSRGGKRGLLSEKEIVALETDNPDGLTAAQIVELFSSRGLRFSEATFRKYVQQGLLPRSRRVGRKGKHRGSLGLYPVKTIRRINAVKQLMGEGYTIEQIHEQFLQYADVLENVDEGIADVLARLEAELDTPRFDAAEKKSGKREITEVRRIADDLVDRLEKLSRRVSAPRGERFRSTGAAGSAEDLL